jgi:hypothetical protein
MRFFEFQQTQNTNIPSAQVASQDKKDIMTLIGLKPSSEALAKVRDLLGPELTTSKETEPVEPELPVDPSNQPDPTSDDQETLKKESVELLDENVLNILVDRIKSLDPNNPKDAIKISAIETILESDVIEPAVEELVRPRFRSFQDAIIADVRGALIDAPNPVMDKINFLDKCKTGIVDLQATFKSSPAGNIYNLADDAVLNNIKKRLAMISYGVGSSKLGNMEVLLILIGKNVSKEGSGDITLADGTDVEIKASKTDKKDPSGAVLYALAKDKDNQPLYGSNIDAGETWTATMSKIMKNPPISLNAKSVKGIINPAIAGNPKKVEYTVNAIKAIYKTIFRKASPTIINYLDKIATPEGIDALSFVKISRMIEFEYYKKALGHEAVMFVNITSGNYRYISKSSDLLKQLSASKGDFYSTGIIDMQGSYANGLSKVFIA